MEAVNLFEQNVVENLLTVSGISISQEELNQTVKAYAGFRSLIDDLYRVDMSQNDDSQVIFQPF